MSTIPRTIGYLRRIGLKEYWHQLQYIGDTKVGTLVGVDKFGNKYFQNDEEELPLRTRWVDYKKHDFDPAQIEPMWHAWISYSVDVPPTQDPISLAAPKPWAPKHVIPNRTATRGAYKPYSTVVPKISPWIPKAAPRT